MKKITTGILMTGMIVMIATFVIASYDLDQWSVRGNVYGGNIVNLYDIDEIEWAKGQFSSYVKLNSHSYDGYGDQTQGKLSVRGVGTVICEDEFEHHDCHCDEIDCHRHENFRFSVNWNWKGNYAIESIVNDDDMVIINSWARVAWNRDVEYWTPVTITIDKENRVASVEDFDFKFVNIDI